MSYATKNIPPLEDQFLQPPGWRWHGFSRKEGRTIRFGSAFPKDSIPDAVAVCLPGLGEFSEKYFETAQYCLSKNIAFWIIDWAGQGRSMRYLENPHKRHADNFQEDVDDLHYFIMEYIKHACVHPDVGRIPMAMLGHSMGANIGMHYLSQHPERFECAAFTSPMFGLKVFENTPAPLARFATSALNLIAKNRYAFGEGDWSEKPRADPGNNRFSSNPIRGSVHNSWCASNPDLQVGHLTYGWLYQAEKSCAALQKKKLLNSIPTHCLLASAGLDDLVDNKVTAQVAKQLEHAQLLEYPGARHEILMESNDIRDDFLDHFYKLIIKCIIERPETLKPF